MLSAAPGAPTGYGRLPATGAPDARVRTRTAEQVAASVDVLALKVGTRITASALLLACVVVILLGAQSTLSTMQGMDHDIAKMNELLATSNAGLNILNTTMTSVEPTSKHLSTVVQTVQATRTEVATSTKHINGLATTTKRLDTRLGSIAASTHAMRVSLQQSGASTTKLSGTITELNGSIGPLVKTQHEMYLGTKRMRAGLAGMNGSIAYVVRILNYITAPPTGATDGTGMQVRADLPRETLPPLPGLKADAKPLQVFPRMAWPIYEGP